jgi:hypothetical protein
LKKASSFVFWWTLGPRKVATVSEEGVLVLAAFLSG